MDTGYSEKALKPVQKKVLVNWLKICYKVSARGACRFVRLRRATFCYQSKRPEQAYLRKRIKEIAAEKPQYGYRGITILIRREGLPVNTKRVYRIYKDEGLQMRKKVPKRRVIRVSAARQNQCWSMDFVSDNLYNGQKLRCLTIVDNHTRISLAIGVVFRYTA
jgi:putative transposase